MTVSLSSTGLPGDDYHGGAMFYIMDNTCKIRAAYEQPSCGIPYVARENFLKYVLSVTSLSADVGSPYFSFNYGDGKYSIRNNGCVCGDMKSAWNGGSFIFLFSLEPKKSIESRDDRQLSRLCREFRGCS